MSPSSATATGNLTLGFSPHAPRISTRYAWSAVPFGIGPLELAIVLVIVLVIFGPKRLPGVGRALGTGMREFKDSITGKDKGDEDSDRELPPAAPASTAAGAEDASGAFGRRDD